MTDISTTIGSPSNSDLARHYFVPWLRRGLAAKVTQNKDDGDGGALAATGTLSAQLTLNPEIGSQPNPVPISFYGPWNVTGFDARAVIRTWPREGVFDAEANHYPLVEFDQADLPWRYTPADPNPSSDRLRPWLCLLVLSDEQIKALRPPSSAHPLPTVQAKTLSDLPDLKDSWSWAHVQVTDQTAPAPSETLNLIRDTPHAVISRILYTQPLQPKTSYTAFLVPTFKSGIAAGMGTAATSPNAGESILPAWDKGLPGDSDAPMLPIYYQWRIQTSEVGDFKYFVNLLSPIAAPIDIGTRLIDVSSPGENLSQASSQPMSLQGALVSPNLPLVTWPDPAGTQFISGLTLLLNLPDQLQTDVTQAPALVPPLYGQWHANQTTLNPGAKPFWFEDLNSDPRLRVAAGLGTLVIQDQEQQLLTSAWSQFGDLPLINLTLSQGQFSRQISSSLYDRHVVPLESESLVMAMSPVLSKLRGSPVTLRHLINQSPIALGALEPQMRRVMRPYGPIGKRQDRPKLPKNAGFLSRMNSGELAPAAHPPTPSKMATPENTLQSTLPTWLSPTLLQYLWLLPWLLIGLAILGLLFFLIFAFGSLWVVAVFSLAIAGLSFIGYFKIRSQIAKLQLTQKMMQSALQSSDVQDIPPKPGFVAKSYREVFTQKAPLPSPSPMLQGSLDSKSAAAFRASSIALLTRVQAPPEVTPVPKPIDMQVVHSKILSQMDPRQSIAQRLNARLDLHPDFVWQPVDPIKPVMAYPHFLTPMYKPLLALSTEWIMPGLSQVPQNSVTLLANNQKFIEAYLVGLNHEMGRKLLWNGFPTDERGTYFQHFWDVTGLKNAQPLTDTTLKDITEIHTWQSSSQLGDHNPNSASANVSNLLKDENLVLLVRGELLHRYPNTLVYATKALLRSDLPANVDFGSNTMHVPSTDPSDEIYPIFKGTFSSDTHILGFELTESRAKGNPASKDYGYFFVFQEIPSEPQFAYDVGDPGEYDKNVLNYPATDKNDNSALLARLSFRNPMRVAIHANRML